MSHLRLVKPEPPPRPHDSWGWRWWLLAGITVAATVGAWLLLEVVWKKGAP